MIFELNQEDDINMQMPQCRSITLAEVLTLLKEKVLVKNGMDVSDFMATYLPKEIHVEFVKESDDLKSRIAQHCKTSEALQMVNTRIKELKSELEAAAEEVANQTAKLSNYREIVALIQEETTKIQADISSTKAAVERLVLLKLTETERMRQIIYCPSSEINGKIQDLKNEIAATEAKMENLLKQKNNILKLFGIEHEVLNVFAPDSLTSTLFCVSYDEALATEKLHEKKAFYLCDDKCGTRVWKSPEGPIMKEAVNYSRNIKANHNAEVIELPSSIERAGLKHVMQKFQEVKSEYEMLALQVREREQELVDLHKVDALMTETVLRKRRGILKTYTGKIEYLSGRLENMLHHLKVQNLMKELVIKSIQLLKNEVRVAENFHEKASKNVNSISAIVRNLQEGSGTSFFH